MKPTNFEWESTVSVGLMSCLFFGSTDAPIRFAKLTLLPVAWLRRRGARLVVKLDDFLTLGRPFWEAKVTTNVLVCLLDWLGFVVNHKKSSWTPAQEMEWLGIDQHQIPCSRVSHHTGPGEGKEVRAAGKETSQEAHERQLSQRTCTSFV